MVGVCRPVPQILTQYQTKIFHFPHPFSDLAPKIHTRLQSAEVKNSDRMIYFGFFSFSTINLEKTNTFLRPHGSLKNHTRFKTIMVKNLYPFSDQNGPNTIPFGAAHTYIAYIGEYPPPGSSTLLRKKLTKKMI